MKKKLFLLLFTLLFSISALGFVACSQSQENNGNGLSPKSDEENKSVHNHLLLSEGDFCSVCGLKCVKNPDGLDDVLMGNDEGTVFRAEFYETNITSVVFEEYKIDITEIYVGDTVVSIKQGAFRDCNYLQKITLPFVGKNKTVNSSGSASVETSFFYVFDEEGNMVYNHTSYVPRSLETVVITGGIVGKSAFESCSYIKNVVLSDSIRIIGDQAFFNCLRLKNISFGNQVDTIGSNAFAGCSELEYYVYDEARYLGNQENNYLFLYKANNASKNSYIIKGSTKVIDEYAFFGCRVNSVYYESTERNWRIISKNKVLLSATKYYFSETAPTDTSYSYWHYVDGVPTAW